MGRHDFTHFANVTEAHQSPLKTITRFDVLLDEHGFEFQVEGSGFLYKMVGPGCSHICLHRLQFLAVGQGDCKCMLDIFAMDETSW